jgi:hypothetical protein
METQTVLVPVINYDAQGDIIVTASPTSSKHDFDFYIGKWHIHNKKLNERLQQCTTWTEFDATGEMHTILNGLGNTDSFAATINGNAFEGMTLRLFNSQKKLWSIYWADSNKGLLDPPVTGSFENGIGYFFGKDTHNGKPVTVVFCWDARDADKPVWSQAFYDAQNKNWEWNWYMYFTRI